MVPTVAIVKRTKIRSDNEKARALFLQRVRSGSTIADALVAAKRSRSTYNKWRQEPEFLAELEESKKRFSAPRETPGRIGFQEFSERYLGQPMYQHQLQWLDLLEGRLPRDLHDSQTFEEGDRSFVLINTPPEHAKTSTISINYPTYRVVTDPNVRIILVSKTAERAKEFLYAIKTRLTHPRYADLQHDFGPQSGYKDDSVVWAADRIYLGSERDSGEKDPTVQAIGIGGQIYGARSDLIIIDDAVVLSNAHEYEKQIRWIQQEVITRLGPSGRLLIVGTRVDTVDMYREIRVPDRYPEGVSPWTYLAQPAVLSYADRPEDWVTLWPRANVPWSPAEKRDADDLFPRWSGRHLYRRRGMIAARTWAMAYMQAQVEEDSVFDPIKVRGAVNGLRQPGRLARGAPGHRVSGMDGLYVVASMDPAMVGDTGVIVYAVDRFSKKRYVLDVLLRTGATPAWIRQTIRDVTERYGVAEWRIEKNAFQQFLTQDEQLQQYLASLGVRLSEHHTGKNKWDVDFGVASMSSLFDSELIELPSTHQAEPVRQLIEQLVTWSPETKAKTDLVMALWFAEIRAREICQQSALDGDGAIKAFMPNRYLSRRARQRQTVVNLNDHAASRRG